MADDLKSEESRSPAKDCGFSYYRLAVLRVGREPRTRSAGGLESDKLSTPRSD